MTLAAITRLLLYLGAMIVVGEAALALVFRRASPAVSHVADASPDRTISGAARQSLSASLRRVTLGGWALVSIAVAALLLLQGIDMELAATTESAALLWSTTWGRGWAVLAAAGVFGLVVALLRAAAPWRALSALCLAIAMGGLGHAAADAAFPRWARVIDAAHVLATAAWMGGLAIVAWLQWHERADASTTPLHSARSLAARSLAPGSLAATWRAFSRMATIAAPLAVLTGLTAGWRRLQLPPLDQGASVTPSLGALAVSNYGLLLGAKSAAVLLTLALGYKHRRRVLEEYAPSWNTVVTELALAVVVLAVTGVLTGTAPPGE